MSYRTLGRHLGWSVLVVVLAANLVVGSRLYSQETPTDPREDAYAKIELFTRAIEQIRENYVDPDKVSYEDLVYGALQGMLESLDAHSQFLDADMYKDMQDDTAGQFGGLGIVISMKDGVLTIVAPMEDTPGFRAGLLAGDTIVEIDGESTESMDLQDAVKRLRGMPGTKVTLRILRPKRQEFRSVEIERANIEVASVKDVREIEDGIGYLRITQFSEPTADALRKALGDLEEKKVRAIVIDLRNNPGGLLNSAIDVSQMFLSRGSVIVSTQGRNARQDHVYRARGRKPDTKTPIAILVNAGSASASEIVAGALQDNRRAVLVGEKTFGKGSVQSVLPMDEGAALRLTTAKYYTPSAKVIHERGIEPDIIVPMSPEDWRLLQLQRVENAGGADAEELERAKSVEDVQLRRAVDVLKGILRFADVSDDASLAALAR